MYIKQNMKRKRDTTTDVKHAESIERGYEKEKIRSTAALPNLKKTKYYYLKRQKRQKK